MQRFHEAKVIGGSRLRRLLRAAGFVGVGLLISANGCQAEIDEAVQAEATATAVALGGEEAALPEPTIDGGVAETDIEATPDANGQVDQVDEACTAGESDCAPLDLACGYDATGVPCSSEYGWWRDGLVGATASEGWVISEDPEGGQTYGEAGVDGLLADQVDVAATTYGVVTLGQDTVDQLNTERPCHLESADVAVLCSGTAEQLEAGPHLVVVTEFVAPIWVDGGFALDELVEYAVVLGHPTEPGQNLTPPAGFELDFLSGTSWMYRAAGLDNRIRASFGQTIDGVANVQGVSNMTMTFTGNFMEVIIPVAEFGPDFVLAGASLTINTFGFQNSAPGMPISPIYAGGDLGTDVVANPFVLTVERELLPELIISSSLTPRDSEPVVNQRTYSRDTATELMREFEHRSQEAIDQFALDGDLSAFASRIVPEFVLYDAASRSACETALATTLALATSFEVVEFPTEPDLSLGGPVYIVTIQINYSTGPAVFMAVMVPGLLGDYRLVFLGCGQ